MSVEMLADSVLALWAGSRKASIQWPVIIVPMLLLSRLKSYNQKGLLQHTILDFLQTSCLP